MLLLRGKYWKFGIYSAFLALYNAERIKHTKIYIQYYLDKLYFTGFLLQTEGMGI